MAAIIMLMKITVSDTTTIENQDSVAIQTTVNAAPIPTVFLVNMEAKISGINASRSNP